MNSIRDQALASYLGLAIGDALGATTEFMTPREIQAQYKIHRNLIGGGWLHLKPGRVTDDTEMSLALGEAILEAGGMDAKVVAEKFTAWMRSKPVDIGSTVRLGIRNFISKGSTVAEPSEYAAGNGVAMRNLPVILTNLTDVNHLHSWTLTQGHITHNNEESDIGTLFLSDMTRLAILLGQSAPLKSMVLKWTGDYPKFHYYKYKGNTDGYIVNTVRTVLHFFFNTGDFESCMIGIVNAGGDADTNGAIAGMLAGAFYGLDSIPERWIKKLDPDTKKKIETQVNALLDNWYSEKNDTAQPFTQKQSIRTYL